MIKYYQRIINGDLRQGTMYEKYSSHCFRLVMSELNYVFSSLHRYLWSHKLPTYVFWRLTSPTNLPTRRHNPQNHKRNIRLRNNTVYRLAFVSKKYTVGSHVICPPIHLIFAPINLICPSIIQMRPSMNLLSKPLNDIWTSVFYFHVST
jgi:hypothetical protein